MSFKKVIITRKQMQERFYRGGECMDKKGNRSEQNIAGEVVGGITKANYDTTNKVFEEEKFHATQGHGFAAER